MVGWIAPPNSFCGGEASATDDTPATRAGTTFMTTLDGYTALPPGTYSPTLSIGLHRWITSAPVSRVVTVGPGTCAFDAASTRSMASSSASRTAGARWAMAAGVSAGG